MTRQDKWDVTIRLEKQKKHTEINLGDLPEDAFLVYKLMVLFRIYPLLLSPSIFFCLILCYLPERGMFLTFICTPSFSDTFLILWRCSDYNVSRVLQSVCWKTNFSKWRWICIHTLWEKMVELLYQQNPLFRQQNPA